MSEGLAQAIQWRKERVARLAQWCADEAPGQGTRVLEIGCGHGHFLTGYAQAHPDAWCVGLDLVTKRIEKARSKAAKRGLDRLRFLKAEVGEFLDAVPDNLRFDRVFMLFPDPWPKKRHHKNRMIQPDFLARLAEITTPRADFCFRTDHPALFDWAVEHLDASPEWEMDPAAAWPFEETSYFQEMMESWQSLVARKPRHEGLAESA